MKNESVSLPPDAPLRYAERIMEVLDGMSDECIESTMKIVRALLEYRSSVRSSSASEEQTPQLFESQS